MRPGHATRALLLSVVVALTVAACSSGADATVQGRLVAVGGGGAIVAATPENVRKGTYRFRRAVYLTFPKDLTTAKPAVRAFVEFVRSPEGRRCLRASSASRATV